MTKRNSMSAVFESVDEVGTPLVRGSPSAGPMSGASETKVLSGAVLSEAVQELAASLGVEHTPKGNGAYDPDVFLRVVTRERDKLMEIQRTLTRQNQCQQAREGILEQREAAVAWREKRIEALEALVPVPERKPWWKRIW